MKTTLSINKVSNSHYQVIDDTCTILKNFKTNMFGTALSKATKFYTKQAPLYYPL